MYNIIEQICRQHALRTQSVEKTSIIVKNGVWGVAPRQVAGTPVPVFSPFPRESGQGDRDSKLEVCFKNRLFLQSEHALRAIYSASRQSKINIWLYCTKNIHIFLLIRYTEFSFRVKLFLKFSLLQSR